MSDFKAITTQEEFDAAIGERIKRERETLSKKYEGYISPAELAEKEKAHKATVDDLNEQLGKAKKDKESHEKTVNDLHTKIKGYESASVKTRIAHEVGLPYEMAGRLSGEDEASIRQDAESLAKLMESTRREAPPLASRSAAEASGRGEATDAAYMALLGDLEGGK